MENSRLDYLFQRYLDGACSINEEQELLDFITTHNSPELRLWMEALWNKSAITLSAEKADKIVDEILEKSRALPVRKERTNALWLKVAATVTLIALTASVYYWQGRSQHQLLVTEVPARVPDDLRFIKLPDGSSVILNKGSFLNFPKSFDALASREVHLTGEAFFDIKHDASKPFIVHTGKLKTTVLGTAFNVKAYPDQNDITVTVTRGKVSVANEAKVIGIITPEQQITFHKASKQADQQNVRSKNVVAWVEKDILFDDVSMEDAARMLKDRFHVQINFANEKIMNCRFTATFIKGEDLQQILDVICEFNQATYTTDEAGNIEIYGSGCAPL
jgi:ferric-dicitrate binding protein FerR (iron transport regulator)